MTSVQERLKLKRAPTDIWSVREQLCLASSVLKSGDQNWMSVSRSLRPIADKDSTRPLDWFSQKSCAQQYAYLLENTDIPKRKKRESGETTSESIVRRLTQDRISELSKTLVNQREEYQQLKNEISLLKNGTIPDEKLQNMWFAIEQEEKEQKSKAHLAWLSRSQQIKEPQSIQTLNIQNVQKKVVDISLEKQEGSIISTEDEEKRSKSGRSSLLTSLLKSPSPTTQIQAAGSPTIASLLCSSPKVPAPVIMQSVSPQLHQLVSNIVPNLTQERSASNAPTLSMLLEQPTAGTHTALQQQLQNTSSLINSKDLQSNIQIQNTIQTRSSRLVQNNLQIAQVQQVISSSDLSNTEIPQIISNPIDDVMPKVMQMDKDEINEIIGDIEELIKEEITGSPQTLESSTRTVEMIDNLNIQETTELSIEHSKPRNDETVSVSNSPNSEISIEEIDSSTSNIAEIIGTAIRTVESKININNELKEKENIQETEFTVEDRNKEIVESITSQELKIETESIKEVSKQLQSENNNNAEVNILIHKKSISNKEKNKEDSRKTRDSFDEKIMDYNKVSEQEFSKKENKLKDNEKDNKSQEISHPEIENITADTTNDSSKLDKKNELEPYFNILKEVKPCNDPQKEEKKKIEENISIEKIDNSKLSREAEIQSTQTASENIDKVTKDIELLKEYIFKQESNNIEKENKKDFKGNIEDSNLKDMEKKEEFIDAIKQELDTVIDSEISNKLLQENIFVGVNNEKVLKKEKLEPTLKNERIKENDNSKNNEINDQIKMELKKENIQDNEEEYKPEIKKEIENDTIKKESLETVGSVEELDEEEPTLSKLSGGRAMKTYSKKQNATVDSEPENEPGGETADYRAWKKSIMLVYNRLATHKYASIFLRPITEDQAPGYHSIIFRPMDLWTIKKNIDNGTIRSTTHFQRDVMLMFQNAIMFNKYNTLVHKMTLEMQEECLQHMQVLVRATGEASFRRETRTAANIINETTDNSLKRKWTHISCSPHETESIRMKKRRKSEND